MNVCDDGSDCSGVDEWVGVAADCDEWKAVGYGMDVCEVRSSVCGVVSDEGDGGVRGDEFDGSVCSSDVIVWVDDDDAVY